MLTHRVIRHVNVAKTGKVTLRRKSARRIVIEKVFRENEKPLRVDEVIACGRKQVHSLDRATV